MFSSNPMDFHVSETEDRDVAHVSKGRSLLKSVLLCAALGISSCATPKGVAPHVPEKANSGADAGKAVEKHKGGGGSNSEGEWEERMKENCEQEGYLNPIDCNLDTEPDDDDPAKVKFRAVFI